MNLVLAWLSTRRHRESSFHHCGGPVKLLEAWLCTRRHLESSFHPLWRFCKRVQVIVIAQVPGIYGSKQTESEGVARGRGLFTTAINPWPPVL